MRIFLMYTILMASLFVSACSPQEEPQAEQIIRPVKTITVAATRSIREKTYPAIVLPAQQAELSFRASGQIVEMPVKAASEVKEDDIIAKLDTKDFETQVTGLESQLEQAQAQLEALTTGAREEDVASLKANIAAAEAKVAVVRGAYDRTRQLFEKGIVAKAKLDGDQAELDVAIAQLEATRQELIKGQSGGRKEEVAVQIAAIKGIEANLSAAKDNLANATLRAPFDGIIARRDVDNFSNIQAKQTIVVLQKLDKLELSFDVPGPDIAKLNRENPPSITVSLDAIADKSLAANLVEFNTIANTSTQTFTGRVAIGQPGKTIVLPGMTGQVTLTDNNGAKRRIQIPGTALASDPDGKSYVWIVKGDTVSKREVSPGGPAGDMIEISDGLKEGDVVVTAGVSFLQEGMKVRVETGGE